MNWSKILRRKHWEQRYEDALGELSDPQPMPLVEHKHGDAVHAHAYGGDKHDHPLRVLCVRPECVGSMSHLIHKEVPDA